MNLFRLILILFGIYFIRRVYQFFKFLKLQNQALQEQLRSQNKTQKEENSIEAEYKIID